MDSNKLYILGECYPNKEDLNRIVTNYLKHLDVDYEISQLYVGMKNIVYLIKYNCKKIVLKVAPINNETMLTFENNNIEWETKMLKLMESLNIPAPKLLLFDDSCSIYGAPYIFMTYLDGAQFQEVKKELPQLVINKIEEQIGCICSKISKTNGTSFFLPFLPNCKIRDNYNLVMILFQTVTGDAKKKNITIGDVSYDYILKLISSFKNILNMVTVPKLVNADAWDGNIIVDNNGTIVGIVDFSDLYYCDELMTLYFHNINLDINKNFLKGYGKMSFTEDELIRISIYRIFTLIKMIVEKEYKVEKDKLFKYEWLYDKFYIELKKLNQYNEQLNKTNYIV